MALTEYAVMFGDLREGGYIQIYAIEDNGTVIGRKVVKRETRKGNEVVTYQLKANDRVFTSAWEFKLAYDKENGH